MVSKNIIFAPVWFTQMVLYGRDSDKHTVEERFALLKKITVHANKAGRVIIKANGLENLPKEDGFIMFPNHQGLFDVLALIEASSHPFGVVIKKEAAGILLVKQVVRALRGIAIDRDDIKSAMEIIRQMTREVKEGRNYVIFPEGTRSRNGNQILPFKAGTFKSAVNARCPIVPVALIDSYRPFDEGGIGRRTVQVHFLPPLMPEQYIGKKTVEIADIVHDSIQEKIDQNI